MSGLQTKILSASSKSPEMGRPKGFFRVWKEQRMYDRETIHDQYMGQPCFMVWKLTQWQFLSFNFEEQVMINNVAGSNIDLIC